MYVLQLWPADEALVYERMTFGTKAAKFQPGQEGVYSSGKFLLGAINPPELLPNPSCEQQ